MILEISSGSRDYQDPELKAAREVEIKEILSRGKIAVFTRPHSIIPSITVVKKVAEWKQDDETEDLISLNGSYIAYWAKEYTITEEPWAGISSEG